MKPFNLQEAKAGKPVCTRDGRNARIICFDVKSEYFSIVALVDTEGKEFVGKFDINGRYYYETKEDSPIDLFMKPEKHEGWGWVSHNNIYSIFTQIYETKEEALSHKPDRGEPYLASVEWEE